MRSLLIGILISIAMSNANAKSLDDDRELLSQAIEVYQQALDETDRDRRVQRFRRAQSMFESIIERQRSDSSGESIQADLYFNLGNAALGAEELGTAVLAFRRALNVQPNHPRAEQNLQFARSLLPNWVPLPEPSTADSFRSMIDGVQSFRSSNGLGLAAILFFISTMIAVIYLRSGKVWIRNLALLAAVVWIVVLASVLSISGNGMSRAAVVRADEVIARSADSIHAPAMIREPLPGGTEVTILDDRVDWVRVRLHDGREVWLPASALESV